MFDDLYLVDFVVVDLVFFVVLSPGFNFFLNTIEDSGWEERPQNDLFCVVRC